MLRNFEVLEMLNKKYGIKIESVQKLNKIYNQLGLIEKKGNDWIQTDLGMTFCPSKVKFYRANEWKETIVDYLASHLRY